MQPPGSPSKLRPKPNPLRNSSHHVSCSGRPPTASDARRSCTGEVSADRSAELPSPPVIAAARSRDGGIATVLRFDGVDDLVQSAAGRAHRRTYRPPSVQPFRQLGDEFAAAAASAAASAASAANSDRRATACCSPNVRILCVAAVLFGTITLVQFVAALAANSMALLADCVCMAVDTLSYVGNIAAECAGEVDAANVTAIRRREWQRVAAAGVSLALLLGFTVYFLVEAVRAIGTEDDGEEVDPYIVLAFAIAGLLFDAASLAAFRCMQRVQPVDGGEETEIVPAIAVGTSSPSVPAVSAMPPKQAAEGLNMVSALLHVLSDSLRSAATLCEAILILGFPNVPSSAFDAWATVAVTTVILIALGGPSVGWANEVWRLACGRGAMGAYAELADLIDHDRG
eukprot:SAG31_NODE_4430_length_3236_cov_2.591011_1_plen_400_part_00